MRFTASGASSMHQWAAPSITAEAPSGAAAAISSAASGGVIRVLGAGEGEERAAEAVEPRHRAAGGGERGLGVGIGVVAGDRRDHQAPERGLLRPAALAEATGGDGLGDLVHPPRPRELGSLLEDLARALGPGRAPAAERQRPAALAQGERRLLGDHAAHRVADERDPLDPEASTSADEVLRPALDRVRAGGACR